MSAVGLVEQRLLAVQGTLGLVKARLAPVTGDEDGVALAGLCAECYAAVDGAMWLLTDAIQEAQEVTKPSAGS